MSREREATRYQAWVLHVLVAIGPCSPADITAHSRQSGRAVRQALYRLRAAGYVRHVLPGRVDATAIGRQESARRRRNAG